MKNLNLCRGKKLEVIRKKKWKLECIWLVVDIDYKCVRDYLNDVLIMMLIERDFYGKKYDYDFFCVFENCFYYFV